MKVNFNAPLTLDALEGTQKPAGSAEDFSKLVTNAIEETVSSQKAAYEVSSRAAAGEEIPMHEVIASINKAETTLQTMLTVRDRAVEAYQQILQMPI